MVVDKTLGGRPPLKIPDKDLDRLGKDLLDWLDGEGKDSIFFQDWYFDKHGLSRSDWKGLIHREGFQPYYEVARIKLSRNIMSGELDKSFTHRYLGMYDDNLHSHEEGVRDRDVERKSKDSSNFLDFAQNLAKMQAFFDQVQSMQTSKSKAPEEDRKE